MFADSTCTFVFEEVAHPGSTRKHKLRDIFDDLGLVFWRQGREPFGKSLSATISKVL